MDPDADGVLSNNPLPIVMQDHKDNEREKLPKDQPNSVDELVVANETNKEKIYGKYLEEKVFDKVGKDSNPFDAFALEDSMQKEDLPFNLDIGSNSMDLNENIVADKNQDTINHSTGEIVDDSGGVTFSKTIETDFNEFPTKSNPNQTTIEANLNELTTEVNLLEQNLHDRLSIELTKSEIIDTVASINIHMDKPEISMKDPLLRMNGSLVPKEDPPKVQSINLKPIEQTDETMELKPLVALSSQEVVITMSDPLDALFEDTSAPVEFFSDLPKMVSTETPFFNETRADTESLDPTREDEDDESVVARWMEDLIQVEKKDYIKKDITQITSSPKPIKSKSHDTREKAKSLLASAGIFMTNDVSADEGNRKSKISIFEEENDVSSAALNSRSRSRSGKGRGTTRNDTWLSSVTPVLRTTSSLPTSLRKDTQKETRTNIMKRPILVPTLTNLIASRMITVINKGGHGSPNSNARLTAKETFSSLIRSTTDIASSRESGSLSPLVGSTKCTSHASFTFYERLSKTTRASPTFGKGTPRSYKKSFLDDSRLMRSIGSPVIETSTSNEEHPWSDEVNTEPIAEESVAGNSNVQENLDGEDLLSYPSVFLSESISKLPRDEFGNLIYNNRDAIYIDIQAPNLNRTKRDPQTHSAEEASSDALSIGSVSDSSETSRESEYAPQASSNPDPCPLKQHQPLEPLQLGNRLLTKIRLKYNKRPSVTSIIKSFPSSQPPRSNKQQSSRKHTKVPLKGFRLQPDFLDLAMATEAATHLPSNKIPKKQHHSGHLEAEQSSWKPRTNIHALIYNHPTRILEKCRHPVPVKHDLDPDLILRKWLGLYSYLGVGLNNSNGLPFDLSMSSLSSSSSSSYNLSKLSYGDITFERLCSLSSSRFSLSDHIISVYLREMISSYSKECLTEAKASLVAVLERLSSANESSKEDPYNGNEASMYGNPGQGAYSSGNPSGTTLSSSTAISTFKLPNIVEHLTLNPLIVALLKLMQNRHKTGSIYGASFEESALLEKTSPFEGAKKARTSARGKPFTRERSFAMASASDFKDRPMDPRAGYRVSSAVDSRHPYGKEEGTLKAIGIIHNLCQKYAYLDKPVYSTMASSASCKNKLDDGELSNLVEGVMLWIGRLFKTSPLSFEKEKEAKECVAKLALDYINAHPAILRQDIIESNKRKRLSSDGELHVEPSGTEVIPRKTEKTPFDVKASVPFDMDALFNSNLQVITKATMDIPEFPNDVAFSPTTIEPGFSYDPTSNLYPMQGHHVDHMTTMLLQHQQQQPTYDPSCLGVPRAMQQLAQIPHASFNGHSKAPPRDQTSAGPSKVKPDVLSKESTDNLAPPSFEVPHLGDRKYGALILQLCQFLKISQPSYLLMSTRKMNFICTVPNDCPFFKDLFALATNGKEIPMKRPPRKGDKDNSEIKSLEWAKKSDAKENAAKLLFNYLLTFKMLSSADWLITEDIIMHLRTPVLFKWFVSNGGPMRDAFLKSNNSGTDNTINSGPSAIEAPPSATPTNMERETSSIDVPSEKRARVEKNHENRPSHGNFERPSSDARRQKLSSLDRQRMPFRTPTEGRTVSQDTSRKNSHDYYSQGTRRNDPRTNSDSRLNEPRGSMSNNFGHPSFGNNSIAPQFQGGQSGQFQGGYPQGGPYLQAQGNPSDAFMAMFNQMIMSNPALMQQMMTSFMASMMTQQNFYNGQVNTPGIPGAPNLNPINSMANANLIGNPMANANLLGTPMANTMRSPMAPPLTNPIINQDLMNNFNNFAFHNQMSQPMPLQQATFNNPNANYGLPSFDPETPPIHPYAVQMDFQGGLPGQAAQNSHTTQSGQPRYPPKNFHRR